MNYKKAFKKTILFLLFLTALAYAEQSSQENSKEKIESGRGEH